MASQLKSKKQLLLEGCWRKAWKSSEPLVFSFADKGSAIRARMALYNAAREHKSGASGDALLTEATQNLEICWVEGSKHTSFIMRKIEDTEFIQGLERATGEGLHGYVDPKLKASQEKVKRMMEELDELVPKDLPENPFFKRGG